MIKGRQYIQTTEGRDAFADQFKLMDLPEYGVVVEVKTGAATEAQQGALHVFCRNLAKILNDAGLDQVTVLKPGTAIDWTEESVKEKLWKGVQKAAIGKTSTKDLERDEVTVVYDTLIRHLGEKFGVMCDFPHRNKI